MAIRLRPHYEEIDIHTVDLQEMRVYAGGIGWIDLGDVVADKGLGEIIRNAEKVIEEDGS